MPKRSRAIVSEHMEFSAELWLSPGPGGWTFVTLPQPCAERIRQLSGSRKGGAWGRIGVSARIGASVWQTSIWPDKASASFLLPVKAAVRKAEQIAAGDRARVMLSIAAP